MNRILENFQAGRPSVGTFTHLRSSVAVEALGTAGLDFVILDTEHCVLNPETMAECITAAGAAGLDALVRIHSVTREAVLHPLDLGAKGLIVPAVETVEVYLTSDRKNTVTRKAETGEIQLLVWTADLNREIWPDEEGVEGQRTVSFTPTAVALDGAGNVLWHLDMPMIGARVYASLYRWWPGPEGEWPGFEEALAQQEASSGPF